MAISKGWTYNYADRCECSEDDRCGCSYPENMPRGYSSQTNNNTYLPHEYNRARVGESAINFVEPAVLADNSINQNFNFFHYIHDSHALLIFYRANFSALCPQEIVAFNQSVNDFKNRNIKLVAVSVDSIQAHQTWRKLSYAEGGIGNILFPLVSDTTRQASLAYGVLRPDGLAQRASFFIDRNLKIRYQAVYDHHLRRNTAETLRVIDSLLQNKKAEYN
jgi:peroxiredoxin (alkyl hydroperoxide reductase subunit C)